MFSAKKGGLVNAHPYGYLKNDQSQSFISSLKNIRRVETTVMSVFIMDSFLVNSYPTPCNLLSKDNKKVQSKNRLDFTLPKRSLNNLNRDNHFSCKYYNTNKLKVA